MKGGRFYVKSFHIYSKLGLYITTITFWAVELPELNILGINNSSFLYWGYKIL